MSEDKKLVEMTAHELREVIAHYREQARKAETMGVINEYEVYQRKALIAESYLVDPDLVTIGQVYRLIGIEDHYFKVERIKGIFAWGFRLNGTSSEEGIPLALLQLKE
ncbi:YfhH family protein [Macrococcus equipercicus]|uniref:DUF1811 family protein n=1 Tax=Macrococcus equipercicus TaxID=69967 RepID=A0A9Q9BQ31_9STAP|nr:YfhH family protein [Macrococcus equipercicus]KAA1037672.1 DUF1811 family protein [Macrococcus equipercicus]UTH13384.1 YfhH family protein [Macrococcus equipercicus]